MSLQVLSETCLSINIIPNGKLRSPKFKKYGILGRNPRVLEELLEELSYISKIIGKIM